MVNVACLGETSRDPTRGLLAFRAALQLEKPCSRARWRRVACCAMADVLADTRELTGGQVPKLFRQMKRQFDDALDRKLFAGLEQHPGVADVLRHAALPSLVAGAPIEGR